jgi:hypothetical protein
MSCGDAKDYPLRLTIRSRSGRVLNDLTGASEGFVLVWDEADLQQKLDHIAADPDLERVSLTGLGGERRS